MGLQEFVDRQMLLAETAIYNETYEDGDMRFRIRFDIARQIGSNANAALTVPELEEVSRVVDATYHKVMMTLQVIDLRMRAGDATLDERIQVMKILPRLIVLQTAFDESRAWLQPYLQLLRRR